MDKIEKTTKIKSEEYKITDVMLEEDIKYCIIYFFDKNAYQLNWFINKILRRPLKGNSIPLFERAIDAAFKKLSAKLKYNLFLISDGESDIESDVFSDSDACYHTDYSDESDDVEEDYDLTETKDESVLIKPENNLDIKDPPAHQH